MKLIVGLGNPGKEYEKTRHNVGFLIIDYILKKEGLDNHKEKFNGLYFEHSKNDKKLMFLKPINYMNVSGNVIKKFKDYFNIDIKDILVIHDEADIDFGKYKIKKNGGDAGHNGIKNINDNLKSLGYLRLKIGIKNKKNINRSSYVLKRFSRKELRELEDQKEKYYNIIMDFLNLSFEELSNKYN